MLKIKKIYQSKEKIKEYTAVKEVLKKFKKLKYLDKICQAIKFKFDWNGGLLEGEYRSPSMLLKRLLELEQQGLIRLPKNKPRKLTLPPKYLGKPLSTYIKEMRK